MRNISKGKWFSNIQWAYFIYLFYAVVLLIFLGLFYMIPKVDFLIYPDNKEQVLDEARTARDHFYEAINGGFLKDVDGIQRIGKWSFEHNSDRLEIKPSNMKIIAKYKDVDDNLIEIEQFATKTIVEYIDMTDKVVKPAAIDLYNNSLFITPPERQSLKLKKFNKNFILKQFTGEDTSGQLHERVPIFLGKSVLYLEIPKGLNLTGQGISIINGYGDNVQY